MAGGGGSCARAFTVGEYALLRHSLRKSYSVCVCDEVEVVGWAVDERKREDKGDRSKTPQSGRQTFDRGAL